MNRTQWMQTWKRLRQRWGEWTPTKIEEDDWCFSLLRFSPELVEEVSRHVASTFSSNIPRLAWVLRECESREQEETITRQLDGKQGFHIDADEHETQKEESLKRLEDTPIDELREAFDKAKTKYGELIQRPENQNVREWKSPVRAAVLSELKGGVQS
tara:strand:- start:1077 stop:1547 length:471 start_codon:yes stop_codon:yes gene_type:complete